MNSNKSAIKPVFYDPEKRRWKRFKVGSVLAGIVIALITLSLIINIFKNPALPSLALQTIHNFTPTHFVVKQNNRTNTPRPKTSLKTKTRQQLEEELKKEPSPAPSASPAATTHSTEMVALYVNWDEGSFTSLKKNIQQLDKIVPAWIMLNDQSQALFFDDQQQQNDVLDFIHTTKPNLKILPTVSNFNQKTYQWDNQLLGKLLKDPVAQTQTTQQLLQYVQTKKMQGITVDFENVTPDLQAPYLQYLKGLTKEFHAHQLEVDIVLPADDDSYQYSQLSGQADAVILLVYDEHSDGTPAGSVASQNWYTQVLQQRFTQISPQKVIIAVANSAYDWKDGTQSATSLSFDEVMTMAKKVHANITYDPTTFNPGFAYKDANGQGHTVWFLDSVTLFNQMVVGNVFHPKGWAIWWLGAEDPTAWQVFQQRENLDTAVAKQLESINYGDYLDYIGQGEILQVTSEPQTGQREVTYRDTDGLITNDVYKVFSSPYQITRWGGEDPKKLALTFDDGPDQKYTPQILDILKKYHVPATFFVVGVNADLYPDLLQRTLSEGHEIGNHTFTHPNLSQVGLRQIILEINATERVFETRIGRHSLLFRPPYAEDIEPTTVDQVKQLLATSQLGYYTVSMRIDPQDWSKPGPDQIVQRVLTQAATHEGNIILLHDGGNDRSQTVTALPQIIESLQKQGYQLVTVSDLLAQSRDEVMPPISVRDQLIGSVFNFGFIVLRWLSEVVSFLFLLGIILGIARLTLFCILAIIESLLERRQPEKNTYHPTVSVVVPAHNEEKVIVRTVQSLLDSEYPRLKILVIDDGSTDGTVKKVKQQFKNEKHVQIFSIPNGGKATALNYGIAQTDSEIIIALDADTIFDKHAIQLLVNHFQDPHVGAVAGNAKVGNRGKVLTKWQAVEYITSQNLDRRAFTLLNCVTVVPGAIGAWRRELIEEVGGFANNTLAEDSDLTLAILRHGYRINYEDQAIGYTEAPGNVKDFLKQRFRWTFGTMQVVWKHRSAFFSPKEKVLGFLVLPNILIFQIFFPLISPVMDALMLTSFVKVIMDWIAHPSSFSTENLQRLLLFYIVFTVIDLSAGVVAFLLERQEDWKLLFWLVWQRFFYRQLMYYVVVKSVVTAIRGSLVGWNKLERYGLDATL